MNLCSDNHDEIAYEGRNCPMCELISDHNNAVTELKEKIESLEAQLEEEKEIALDYKARWIESDSEVKRLLNGRLDGER
jgi:hypothetical protein